MKVSIEYDYLTLTKMIRACGDCKHCGNSVAKACGVSDELIATLCCSFPIYYMVADEFSVGLDYCCAQQIKTSMMSHGDDYCADHAANKTTNPAKNAFIHAEYYGQIAPLKESGSTYLEEKSLDLPGADVEVKYPCGCSGSNNSIRSIIMHLNDKDKWTREQIADWLTEIDDPYGDGPDLEFKLEKEIQ